MFQADNNTQASHVTVAKTSGPKSRIRDFEALRLSYRKARNAVPRILRLPGDDWCLAAVVRSPGLSEPVETSVDHARSRSQALRSKLNHVTLRNRGSDEGNGRKSKQGQHGTAVAVSGVCWTGAIRNPSHKSSAYEPHLKTAQWKIQIQTVFGRKRQTGAYIGRARQSRFVRDAGDAEPAIVTSACVTQVESGLATQHVG